jgi:hypothetical protein
MQPNEQLVHRCMVQSELERLQGNEYIAELLKDCAEALCRVPA